MVYLCQIVNLLHAVPFIESPGYGEYSGIRRVRQLLIYISRFKHITHEPVHPLPNHPNPFLDSLLKSPTDSHNLPDTLHRGTYHLGNPLEFIQIPAGNLTHHVIQRRFKTSRGHLRYRIFNLVQPVAHT